MKKSIQQDVSRLKRHFQKNKGRALKSLLLSGLLFFGAAAAIGLRIFYPLHFFVALPFFALSLYFLFSAFLFDRDKVARSATFSVTRNFLFRHKKKSIAIVVIVAVLFMFSKVAPTDRNPFAGMTGEERAELIEADLQAAAVLMDNLELAGEALILSPLLGKESLTADEYGELREKWDLFLSIAMETERVTDVHRYFNRIGYFSDHHEHAKSFIIAYSLYIKKFELFRDLIVRVDGNEPVVKALNEFSSVFGGKGSYDDVLDRFYASDTLLRRNLGRLYLSFLERTVDERGFDESYRILGEESRKSYSRLGWSFSDTTVGIVKKQGYDLEKRLFGAWFPVQKNVSNMMGNFYVSRRHEKMISLEQIAGMRGMLEPGDIMVQRRNWYASNVGIPGFWPHAALHVGTLEDMNRFFSELFPMDGHADVEALLRDRYPELLERYRGADPRGYPHAVIEGKAPGIILQSLEESAQADYLGVLRPRLSKADKLSSILRAFENFGKPYDYNFDFETRDELVCSELVYDAYLPMRNKAGLTFELVLTTGRKIVSPTDMVRKYYEERGSEGRELDFVYFLDGNEDLGKAFVKDEAAFATSWTRPKYSWFQE